MYKQGQSQSTAAQSRCFWWLQRLSGYGGPWRFIFHASMKQADLRFAGAKSQGCQWVVQFVVEFVLVKVNLGDAQQRIINVHKVHSPQSHNSSFPLNLIRSYHHLLYTYDMILYLHTSRIIQRGSREGFLPRFKLPHRSIDERAVEGSDSSWSSRKSPKRRQVESL